MNRPPAALPPSPQRSAVTNGSRMLVGVDGCSAKARRYRDLVEMLTDEMGAGLTEGERLQIRNAATLQMHAEELTAALVRGEAVDPEAITRAANGATRALAALKRQRPPTRTTGPTPAEYLAAKRAAEVAA